MQGPATTLPAKGIAQNCLILNFAETGTVAKVLHWSALPQSQFGSSSKIRTTANSARNWAKRLLSKLSSRLRP